MKAPKRERGFTIIEVLIVMAIAGLIVMIVFLAVPALNRVSRNTRRKNVVALTATALDDYYTNNGNTLPDADVNPANVCSFITQYLKDELKGMGPCSTTLDGAKLCILVKSDTYTLCYHSAFSPHTYWPDEDEISIQLAHHCGTDPTNTGQFPISDDGSPESNRRRYVIVTPLEGSVLPACISNFDHY